MNVTPQFRAWIQSLSNVHTAEPNQLGGGNLTDSAQDSTFEDLLMQEMENSQMIVSSEEILADLDGSPTFQYDGIYTSQQQVSHETSSALRTGRSQASMNQGSVMEKIERIAKSYGVDANLVREVVRAESNFNPNAVSRAGAKGLMQLMDSTARSLKVTDSFDPEQNLKGGTKYLRDLLRKYDGNVKVALAAYNAGPGRIDRLDIDTDAEFEEKARQLPQETQRYVDKITSRIYG
ncbi:lytic transglycosylase domain-containing protein [Brevibacillus migulae]|uniref:lytic transglycosylase domain-containing protein n=1 Tax=Brevibacillus migulae TaxID=1644114 RepID=UPI002E26E1C3